MSEKCTEIEKLQAKHDRFNDHRQINEEHTHNYKWQNTYSQTWNKNKWKSNLETLFHDYRLEKLKSSISDLKILKHNVETPTKQMKDRKAIGS